MKYYPSQKKLKQAQEVVARFDYYAQNKPNKAEFKLYQQGIEEGLKDDKLIDYIYEGLEGSPKLSGKAAQDAAKKAKKNDDRRAKARRKHRKTIVQ